MAQLKKLVGNREPASFLPAAPPDALNYINWVAAHRVSRLFTNPKRRGNAIPRYNFGEMIEYRKILKKNKVYPLV